MPKKLTRSRATPAGISRNKNNKRIPQQIIPIMTGLNSMINRMYQLYSKITPINKCIPHCVISNRLTVTQAELFRSSAFTRKPMVCIKNPQPVTNKQKAPTNTSMYIGTKVNCAPVRLEAFNFIARTTS